MTPAPKRRWLRFSLRTMFVLMTGFGALIGWLAWNLSLVRERRAFWEHFNDHSYSVRAAGLFPPDDDTHLPWIRDLLGDVHCGALIYNPPQDPNGSQLRETRRLFPEAKVYGWPKAEDLPDGIKPVDEVRVIIL